MQTLIDESPALYILKNQWNACDGNRKQGIGTWMRTGHNVSKSQPWVGFAI